LTAQFSVGFKACCRWSLEHLPLLQARLQHVGLSVEELTCHHGEIPKPKARHDPDPGRARMSNSDNTPPSAKRELAVALKFDGENARVSLPKHRTNCRSNRRIGTRKQYPHAGKTHSCADLVAVGIERGNPPALYLAVAEIIGGLRITYRGRCRATELECRDRE